MQTFTVAKQYLYYRFSLAFITYTLLLLLGYFLLQHFDHSNYFRLTLFFWSIVFVLDCLRSFFIGNMLDSVLVLQPSSLPKAVSFTQKLRSRLKRYILFQKVQMSTYSFSN